MNSVELRDNLIRLVESQRIGGKVGEPDYDYVRGREDFLVELDGAMYEVEIRRLP